MLKEVTFRLDATPLTERIVDDLHAYSRWAEAVEVFGTGDWWTKSA